MSQYRLTSREQEVLELMVAGSTNHQIALALSISEYSVKKHVSAIIQKLFARNRTHAAAVAVHEGLVETIIIEASQGKEVAATEKKIEPTPSWEALTGREMGIFLMLNDDRTVELANEGLALRLGITKNTLRKHLRNIYKKLNVSSRASLVSLSIAAKSNIETETSQE